MLGKKFYTIIVVPHAKAKFRKIRVPYSLIVVSIIAGMAIAGGIGYLSYRLINTEDQTLVMADLRDKNIVLRRENEQTREVTDDLRAKLEGFEETVGRFKIMFGIGGEQQLGGTGEVSFGRPPESPNDRYNAFAYLSRLRAEAEALEVEMAELGEQLEQRAIVRNATPAVRPVKNGFISSPFGYRTDPFTGKRKFHAALDISTWYWDEIFATADGTVTKVERNRGSGLFIEISHGFGYTTLYAHLKKANVRPGDTIRRGAVIGYVGSSGRSTGPHLHYEVRYQGIAQNPVHFILDR